MKHEVLKLIEEYMSKGLEYAQEVLNEANYQIDYFFHNSSGWEDYLEKTSELRDKSCAADTVITMLIPFEKIEKHQKDVLDKECLMTIEKFINYCECGAIIDNDGFGYYVKDNVEYDLYASPRMVRNGFVRNEFTHVCWYNK